MNGLLALGERPAGVVAVTAISALLSRISGSTQLGQPRRERARGRLQTLRPEGRRLFAQRAAVTFFKE
jgi:hypothetical protein